MSSARVSESVHRFLIEQKRGDEAFEDVILRLLSVFPVSNWEEERSKTIQLSDEAKDIIKEYRLTDGESINNILTRLLLKK